MHQPNYDTVLILLIQTAHTVTFYKNQICTYLKKNTLLYNALLIKYYKTLNAVTLLTVNDVAAFAHKV